MVHPVGGTLVAGDEVEILLDLDREAILLFPHFA
jgi:hypothetical protein